MAKDKNGTILTGLTLEFESTTPTTIPAAAAGTVTPIFPGRGGDYGCLPAAKLQSFAVQPDRSVRQRKAGDLEPDHGDGAGHQQHESVHWRARTRSTWCRWTLRSHSIGAPVRLPYQPNSMVISNDGSSIYMGSAFELMTFSAISNSLTSQDTSVTGIGACRLAGWHDAGDHRSDTAVCVSVQRVAAPAAIKTTSLAALGRMRRFRRTARRCTSRWATTTLRQA